jgi:hypothetical protein
MRKLDESMAAAEEAGEKMRRQEHELERLTALVTARAKARAERFAEFARADGQAVKTVAREEVRAARSAADEGGGAGGGRESDAAREQDAEQMIARALEKAVLQEMQMHGQQQQQQQQQQQRPQRPDGAAIRPRVPASALAAPQAEVDWSKFPRSWHANTSQPQPQAGNKAATSAAAAAGVRGKGDGSNSKTAVKELLEMVPLDMLLYLNATQDPCEDFYEFACGGWLEDVKIPLTKESVSLSWDTTADTVQADMKALLDLDYPDGSPFRNVHKCVCVRVCA